MKGSGSASWKDKQIMDTFGKVVPQLSELDKEKLLAFGEGVALMAERQRARAEPGQRMSAARAGGPRFGVKVSIKKTPRQVYYTRRGRKEQPMRENLKNVRRAAGLTAQQVADQVGVTLRHYRKLESGDTLGSVLIWDALEDLFEVNQRFLRINT